MNEITNKDLEQAQEEIKKLEATPVQTPADVGEETPETRVN